jgi:molecular chaperone DnaJ
VEYLVEVGFEVAVRGGRISINVPITEECATCGGSGAAPGTSSRTCSECRGSGTVSFGQGGFAVKRPCPACMGRGTIPDKPCSSCGGSGTVRQNRKIQVTVPRGVENGSKVRLTGQGERGSLGGKPGDLIITFRVKPHRFFRRDGLDLEVTVPINIAQAALGSKIRVRTLDGKKVVLKIPPGTQPGTRFRIRGQGVEKGGRVGDMYVEVKLEVPEELSPESQKLMEALAAESELKY